MSTVDSETTEITRDLQRSPEILTNDRGVKDRKVKSSIDKQQVPLTAREALSNSTTKDTDHKSRYRRWRERKTKKPNNQDWTKSQLKLFHKCIQLETMKEDLLNKNNKSRCSKLQKQVSDLKAKLRRHELRIAVLTTELNFGQRLMDYQGHVEKLLRLENKALMKDHKEDAYDNVQLIDETMISMKVTLIGERRKMEAERAQWKEEKDRLGKNSRMEITKLTEENLRLEKAHLEEKAKWNAERVRLEQKSERRLKQNLELKQKLESKLHSTQKAGKNESSVSSSDGNKENMGLSSKPTSCPTNVNSEIRAHQKGSKTGSQKHPRTITAISPWALMKALREIDSNRNSATSTRTATTRYLRRM